ncbi:MAG: GTPase HflX [bacterium]
MIELKKLQEQSVLIGVSRSGEDIALAREHLEELALLIDTAGGIPGKRFIQQLGYPDPRTYVGSGKLMEIREYIVHNDTDLVVFDDELSPSQIRNIERVLNCRIIDRNNLILDIFARRARTSYAKTQVELAQCEYLLPRLTRRWTHLEKQRGGIGLRGPGEQEIETDRRYLRWRIKLLKQKLVEIDRQKSTQRKHRSSMVRVALVGYTNVGKSTIMNLLSKSHVFVEDKLFATLDTTIRKVVIEQTSFLLSDTVGFIRKLPHTLIESFKSTLDEVRESDILIHVVDSSHPDYEEQIDVVKQTLVEIGASDKPTIMVFNKIDVVPLPENIWIARENVPSVFISATEKSHIDSFREILVQEVRRVTLTRYAENEGRA